MNEVLLVDLVLLAFVALTALAVIRLQNLFAAVMLAGIYSLFMAIVWSNMHALDVAFTEASVGAGISTVLLLGCLVWTGRLERARPFNFRAFLVVLITGGVLVYGTTDMPNFGDPNAPIHTLRVPKLMAQTVGKEPSASTYYDIEDPNFGPDPHHRVHPADDFGGHVPNTVTSLLAAYRGYDTMFETTVIFTAGVSLILLLRRREDDELKIVDRRKGGIRR